MLKGGGGWRSCWANNDKPVSSVAEMLNAVGIPPALMAAVVRGDDLVPKDHRPRDGESIKVIAVIGGG